MQMYRTCIFLLKFRKEAAVRLVLPLKRLAMKNCFFRTAANLDYVSEILRVAFRTQIHEHVALP